MEKIYEKLKEMPEKQFNTLQWVLGIFCGIICWVTLRVSGFADDQLISYLFIAVFLVVVLGTRAIARKIERQINKFSFGMAIGLGVCLVIFALCVFVISDRGLIEMIFNIAV